MAQTQRQVNAAEKLLRFSSAALLIGRHSSLPQEFQSELYKTSMSFIELSYSIQKGRFVERDVQDMMQRFVSQVEVLVNAALVPEEALAVIRNEVASLQQDLASLPASFSLLSKDTFSVNDEASPLALFSGEAEKGSTKGASGKRPQRVSLNGKSASGQEMRPQATNGVRDEARSNKILEFLRQNGLSSISDVAKAVPEYSSKTVQRELQTLVDEGKVTKSGERRWSRYSVSE